MADMKSRINKNLKINPDALNYSNQSLLRILQLKEMLDPYNHWSQYMSGEDIDLCIELLNEAKRLLELHHTGEVKNG